MGDGLGNGEKVEDQLEGPAENDGVAGDGSGAKAQGGEKKGAIEMQKQGKERGARRLWTVI
jgi:hypothetical protein